MRSKLVSKRPYMNLFQLITFVVVLAAIFLAISYNRRAQAGRIVGVDEAALQNQIDFVETRQVELQATLTYVESDDYVADYARNEGGYLLPGEKRVVPLVVEGTPQATPAPNPTPDPANEARPWQAWWRLLTDAPVPGR